MEYLQTSTTWNTYLHTSTVCNICICQKDGNHADIYKMIYLRTSTRRNSRGRLQDGIPADVYKMEHLRISTIWNTFGYLQDGIPSDIYKMEYFRTSTKWSTCGHLQDGIPADIYKMEYLRTSTKWNTCGYQHDCRRCAVIKVGRPITDHLPEGRIASKNVREISTVHNKQTKQTSCDNHCGIRLLYTAEKVLARLVVLKCVVDTTVPESQCDY